VSEKEKDLADDADGDATGEERDSSPAAAETKKGAPVVAKAAEDEDSAEADGDGEADADDEGSAARVAEALGVNDAEGDKAEGDDAVETKAEEAAVQNRAARRRDEALERRRKRKPGEKKAEELPKDKNKRAKELLLRRKEAAVEQRPAQLEASELVDDALSRMWDSTTKWLRSNLTAIQWVIAGGIVVAAGVVGYTYFTQKKLGAASGLLASGAMAENAFILGEDKRGEDDKEIDPTPAFKTVDERNEKALASYKEVGDKFPGSGAAILAKLGEAGVLLDKRDYDKAIEAFDVVLKTPLAAADADVKGRAIEGIALAKEGKGDRDGAAVVYKQLEGVDAKGFKELAQYHQARLLLAKNNDEDRNKAKELLKTAFDKLKAPGLDAKPFPYLEKAIEGELRNIDPSLVPDKDSLNGVRGGQMSPEEVQAKLRKIQEELGKKKADGDGH
jgi:hypothetical protein